MTYGALSEVKSDDNVAVGNFNGYPMFFQDVMVSEKMEVLQNDVLIGC